MTVKITYDNAHGSFPVDTPVQMEIGPRTVSCIYRTDKYLNTNDFKNNPNSFLGDIDFDKLIVFHYDESYNVNYLILNNFDTNVVIQISEATKEFLISCSDQFRKAKLQPTDLGDDDHLALLFNLEKNNFNFEEVNHMVKSTTDAARDFSQPTFAPDEGMTYSSYMNLSLATLAASFYYEQEELEKSEFLPNRAKYFEIYPGFSMNCVYTNDSEDLKETFLKDASFNPKSAFHFTESGHFVVSCSNFTILLEHPTTEQLNKLLYHLQNCQLFPVTEEDVNLLINKYLVDMRHFPPQEEQQKVRQDLELVCKEYFPNPPMEPRTVLMINQRYLALTYKTVLAYNLFTGIISAPDAEHPLAAVASSTFALLGINENNDNTEQKEEKNDSNEPKSLVKNNFDIHSIMEPNQIEEIEVLPDYYMTCLFSTSKDDKSFKDFIQEIGCDQVVTAHVAKNHSDEICLAFCTLNHLLLLPKTSSLIQVNDVLFQIQNSQVYCLEEDDRSELFQYYKFDILRSFASQEQLERLHESVNSTESTDFENYDFVIEDQNGVLSYSSFFGLTKDVMKAYYHLSPEFSNLQIENLSEEPGSSEQPESDVQNEEGPLEKIIQPRLLTGEKQIQPRAAVQLLTKENETTSDVCETIDSYEWKDYIFTNREVFADKSDFFIHDNFNFNEVTDIRIDQNDGCGLIRCVLSTAEAPEFDNYANILRPGKVATINFTKSPSGNVTFFSICTGRDLISLVNPTSDHINSVVRALKHTFVIPCNESDFEYLQSFTEAQPFNRIASHNLVHEFEEEIDSEIEKRGVSFKYDNDPTYSKFLHVTYRTYLGFILSSPHDECEKITELSNPSTQYSYVRTPFSLYDTNFDLYQEFNVNTVSQIELAPHRFVNCVISATEDIVFEQYISQLRIDQAVSIHFSASPNHKLFYFTLCTGRDLIVVLNPSGDNMNYIIKKLASSKCYVIPCSVSDRTHFFFYDFLNKISDSRILPQKELPNVVEEINKCASSLYPRGFNYEIPMSYEKFLYIAYKTFVGHYVRSSYLKFVQPECFYPLPAYKRHNFINIRELTPTETLSINKENGRLYVIKSINNQSKFDQTLCIFSNKPQRSSLISPCYGPLVSRRGVEKKLVFGFGSRGTLREVLEENYLDIQTKKRIAIQLAYALAYLHLNGHYPCNISIDNVAVNWNYSVMLTNFFEYPEVEGVSPKEHDIKCLGDIIYTLATGNQPNGENNEAISNNLGIVSKLYDLTQAEGTSAADLVSAILASDIRPQERKFIGRLTKELPQAGSYIHIFPPPPPPPLPTPPHQGDLEGVIAPIGEQLLGIPPPPPEGPEGNGPRPPPREPGKPFILPAPHCFQAQPGPFHNLFRPGPPPPGKFPRHFRPGLPPPPPDNWSLPPPPPPFRGFCPFFGPKGGLVHYLKVDCSLNEGELDVRTLDQLKILRFGPETAFNFIVNKPADNEAVEDRTFVSCTFNECVVLEHVTPKALNIIIPKMENTKLIPVCDEDLDKLFEYYTFDLLKNICRQPELDEIRKESQKVTEMMTEFEDKEITSPAISIIFSIKRPPHPHFPGMPPPPHFKANSLRNPQFNIHEVTIQPNQVTEIEVLPGYTLQCLYSTALDNVLNNFTGSFSTNSPTTVHFSNNGNAGYVSFCNNDHLLLLPKDELPAVNHAIESVKDTKVYCVGEDDRSSLFGYFKFDLINEFASENQEIVPLREKTEAASKAILPPNLSIDGDNMTVSTFFNLARESAISYYFLKNPNQSSFEDLSYQNITGVDNDTDIKKRFKIYSKAAEKNNNPNALYNLGLMYSNGAGNVVKQDKAKAAEYYQRAADQDNDKALFNLALMYYKGEGVPEDKDKAVALYEKSAALGNPKAQSNLGLMYARGDGVEKNYDRAVELFNEAIDKGYADAEFNLGLLYKDGEGVEEDKNKAIELFTSAAEKGNDMALFNLGVMHNRGVENILPKDDEKAFEYYSLAAAKGNTEAQFNLGLLYKKGVNEKIPQDKAKAAQLFEMAAEKGDSDALINLGNLYSKGQGVPLNKAKTVELYEKAAEMNNPKAQYNLGVMYSKGDGVKEDKEKAAEYLEKAASQGLQQAKFNLGVMYFKGQGVEQNKEKAAELFEESAKEGNNKAAFNLGVMYQTGDGVEQNTTRAVELYEQSAEKNNRDALLNLGAIYNEGLDEIDEDVDKAVDYFTRASDLGSRKAQLILGRMYLRGESIDEDLDKAENLLLSASKHHCNEALLDLGDLYAKKGETEKAIDYYKQAVEAGVAGAEEKLNEISPDNNSNQAQLQNLLDSLGERIKALSAATSENGGEKEGENEDIKENLNNINEFVQDQTTNKGLNECISVYKKANDLIKNAEDEVNTFISNEKSKSEEEERNSETAPRSKLPSLKKKPSANASANASSSNKFQFTDEEKAAEREVDNLSNQVQTLETKIDQLSNEIMRSSSGLGSRNEVNLNKATPTSPRRKQPILSPPDSANTSGRNLMSPRAMRNKIKTLQKKADEGDLDAICSLSACYMLGEGVEEDKKKAFELYKEAADQGNADAMYHVGICYNYAKGTDMDKNKGFEYFMKAAEQGNTKAQFAIAHFYEYGNEEYQSDHETAKDWYRKAAENGHKGAITALENFSSEAPLLKEMKSDE